MTTSGNDDENMSQSSTQSSFNQGIMVEAKVANTVISSILKKKTRLGLFYPRQLVLTDEPKLFYVKVAATGRPKNIDLNFQHILERPEKLRFKITVTDDKKQKNQYVFKCKSALETDQWIFALRDAQEKLQGLKLEQTQGKNNFNISQSYVGLVKQDSFNSSISPNGKQLKGNKSFLQDQVQVRSKLTVTSIGSVYGDTSSTGSSHKKS